MNIFQNNKTTQKQYEIHQWYRSGKITTRQKQTTKIHTQYQWGVGVGGGGGGGEPSVNRW